MDEVEHRRINSLRGAGPAQIPWERGVDRAAAWCPDASAPLTCLPSFGELSATQRLRYNQLFALSACEQLIWLEKELLGPIVDRLLRAPRDFGAPSLDPALREGLARTARDQNRHVEMFWRLLERAKPSYYPTRRYSLLSPGLPLKAAAGLWARQPEQSLFRVWAALFLVARAREHSRRYLDSAAPGSAALPIDPLFAACHGLHYREESAHRETKKALLDALYRHQPRWKRKVSGRMGARLVRAFLCPQRNSRRILERLGREFPETRKGAIPRLLAELPRAWPAQLALALGADATARSHDLLRPFPELRHVEKLLSRR